MPLSVIYTATIVIYTDDFTKAEVQHDFLMPSPFFLDPQEDAGMEEAV
jgi:hypothetical protein